MISFVISVVAGIITGLFLYFICKWLDKKLGDD